MAGTTNNPWKPLKPLVFQKNNIKANLSPPPINPLEGTRLLAWLINWRLVKYHWAGTDFGSPPTLDRFRTIWSKVVKPMLFLEKSTERHSSKHVPIKCQTIKRRCNPLEGCIFVKYKLLYKHHWTCSIQKGRFSEIFFKYFLVLNIFGYFPISLWLKIIWYSQKEWMNI